MAYAERDIWEIADYLSDYSMSVAVEFLFEVKRRIEGLVDMPLVCPKINSYQDCKKMAICDYVVAYLLNKIKFSNLGENMS